jgi:hypothetical protein
MAQRLTEFHRDRTAAKKKPGCEAPGDMVFDLSVRPGVDARAS